ncbi:MAG: hypothetical protein ACW98F_03400 [Candidatus Hodarchaeales archaeon]|jgi:regulation of enolase protein 1 (concanavalin A-like superfamily)
MRSWQHHFTPMFPLVLFCFWIFIPNFLPFNDTTEAISVSSIPDLLWSQTYGGLKTDIAHSLVQNSDGNFTLLGVKGNNVGGLDYSEMWLVRTSEQGEMLWNRTYGIDWDLAFDLIQTSDGGLAAVAFSGNSLGLVKFDGEGNPLWNQSFDSSVSYGRSGSSYELKQVSDNGFVIAGYPNTRGYNPSLVIRTDRNGSQIWSREFDAGSEGMWIKINTLHETLDGKFILAGSENSKFWMSKIDENGSPVWERTYEGMMADEANMLIETIEGDFVISGLNSSKIGNIDLWIIRTDASGNLDGYKSYRGERREEGSMLIQTLDSGFLLACTTWSHGEGGSDLWVVKTDIYGNLEWSQTYGGENIDQISDLIRTLDGGYALVGTTWSYGVGEGDLWLLKLDGLVYQQSSIPTSDDSILRILILLVICVILIVTISYQKRI